MNTMYILLVVLTYGGSPPLPAAFSQEFSSEARCEAAANIIKTNRTIAVSIAACTKR